MALALEFLHSRDIAYKDLKAANILLMRDCVDDPVVVKISDYGLASIVTPQGMCGFEGTPGFQAPEIIQGLPYDVKVI